MKISVFGIGGAGCKIINRLVNEGITGAETVAVSLFKNELENSLADKKLEIRYKPRLDGGIEEVLRDFQNNKDKILSELQNTDILVLTGGMGGLQGGTGIPYIAELAKELGILAAPAVTMPYAIEGKKRRENAKNALAKLRQFTSYILEIRGELENDKSILIYDGFKRMEDACIEAISDLIKAFLSDD